MQVTPNIRPLVKIIRYLIRGISMETKGKRCLVIEADWLYSQFARSEGSQSRRFEDVRLGSPPEGAKTGAQRSGSSLGFQPECLFSATGEKAVHMRAVVVISPKFSSSRPTSAPRALGKGQF